MPDILGGKKERFQTITVMKVYSAKSIDVSIKFYPENHLINVSWLTRPFAEILSFNKREAENVEWLCYSTELYKIINK